MANRFFRIKEKELSVLISTSI